MRPRWRLAQSLVTPGEAQRSGFAGKRRSKGTNAVFAARRKRSGVDFATTSRHGQSRSPPALRPQARFGAQPPRQRRLLVRRWRRNPPCGKRTNPNPAPSSVTASPCHLSLSPLSLCDISPCQGESAPRGKAFGRPSVPPLRRKGRFSGGEDTAPTGKRRLWGAPVGHSGVPKWAGFPTPPVGCAPLAHKFLKTGHPGPPGGAGSGWPLKKR